MGSLFTSFNVGVSGLHAAQSGLHTTSHNLANVKTPGYTRQQNMQADKMYQVHKSTDKGLMQIGLGTKLMPYARYVTISLTKNTGLKSAG